MCDDNHRSTGRIFQQVKYQIYCRVKSLVAYIRGLAGIFSCSCIHIYSSTLLGCVLPRDSRGTTSRPFIFIGLLSSRLFKKEGGKKVRREENHMRDMIVLRQHALNQVGFMWKRRAKVKAREEGHWLGYEAPTDSSRGEKMSSRARP